MKTAGDDVLYGTAQGTQLVLVRDTYDACRKVKLSGVLVPGLKRDIFSTGNEVAAQKGNKTVTTKGGSILDFGLFSIQ